MAAGTSACPLQPSALCMHMHCRHRARPSSRPPICLTRAPGQSAAKRAARRPPARAARAQAPQPAAVPAAARQAARGSVLEQHAAFAYRRIASQAAAGRWPVPNWNLAPQRLSLHAPAARLRGWWGRQRRPRRPPPDPLCGQGQQQRRLHPFVEPQLESVLHTPTPFCSTHACW